MPSEIEIMRDKFRQLNLREQVPVIIENDASTLVAMVQSQLKKGQDATGRKITPKYKSRYYAQKKFNQNSEPGFGTPDAYNTGDYYKGMGVITSQTEYLIDSNVFRKSLLQYGAKLTDLNDANKTTYSKGELLTNIKLYIEGKVGRVFD